MKTSGELSIGERLNRISGVVDKPAHAGENKQQIDKQAFMKMLMEQVKYQDPFNPVKNEQFAQHLAVMSQLEQQVETNKNLEKLIMRQSNSQVAALQLVGKNVVANKASVYHEAEKVSDIEFELSDKVAEATVSIIDASGESIRDIQLGPQGMGKVQTKWDGFTEQGMPVPTGRYAFKVEARSHDGKPVEVPTTIEGRVTGVTSQQGKTLILVGKQKVDLDDIESINEAKDGTEDTTKPGEVPANPLAANSKRVDGSASSEEVKTAAARINEEASPNDELQGNAKRLNSLLPLLYK